jgi:hypothetical protein
MKTVDRYMTRHVVDSVLIISVFLGAAWSLGFLLGYG